MKLARMWAITKVVLFGHVFNWLWRPHERRRDVRGNVILRVVPKYLKRYLPATGKVPDTKPINDDENEKIWTIWLQGEESAPELVKACFRSIRRHCKQELVVLDDTNIFDYITLPREIVKKYKQGKIKHAHFADICRVELLYEHGGIWMDATCFVTGAIPDWLIEQDFFVYMYDVGRYKYSFMQNCFIRARRGAYLLAAWREMIHEYWKNEDGVVEYFMHQLMFKTLVENDARAKKYFKKMPHVSQVAAHALWWDYGDKPFDRKVWDKITAESFWQKTNYKSPWVKDIIPGTFADFVVNKA